MCHKKSPCPPPPGQNSDFRDTVNCTHRGPSTTQIRARGFHNDTSRRKHSQRTKHDPDPCQRFPQRYITKKTLTADQARPRSVPEVSTTIHHEENTHSGPSTTQIRARGFHNDTSRRKHSQRTKHDPDPG